MGSINQGDEILIFQVLPVVFVCKCNNITKFAEPRHGDGLGKAGDFFAFAQAV